MARLAEPPSIRRSNAYQYDALDGAGNPVKGTLRATTELAALRIAAERGYTDIVIVVAPALFSLEGALPSLFKIKPLDVAAFSKQLATLLEAGVSLLPALQLMGQQRTHGPALRRVINHITSDLSMGNSFSQAVRKHPQVFNEIYRRSIEVGERTGRMELVLRDLADHIEKQGAFAKKISGAMTYPAIILGVGLVVTFILMIFVLPQMTKLFSTFGTALPLPTRVLMAISNFFVTFKLHILGGVVFVVVASVLLLRRPAGRRFKDRMALTMPVLGGPALMGELARVARTMALMLKAGLPLQETMDVLPKTSSNSLFRGALEQVREGLFLGQGLAYPMAAHSVFPPLMLQMVRVGEESNTLANTMNVVADFYEATTQERLQAMVGLITPLSTIFLAALVGFVALSVIMPMYSITGSLGG